jgi:uncharacterized protein
VIQERPTSNNIYPITAPDEPIILEILDSPPMHRLQGLNQYGMPDRYYHLHGFKRIDHSYGVCQLLKILGAPLEEQVAGLVHDVSHRAFSHVYDWVVGTAAGEGSQDAYHEQFLKNSSLAQILNVYGFEVDRIADYHNFSLLEQPIPDLCADRVDYCLRELDLSVAQEIVSGLTVVEAKIVCADFKTAALFGRAFLQRQIDHWGGYEAVARYHLLSTALKDGLNTGTLSLDDFEQDDEYVIQKLEKSWVISIQHSLWHLRNNPLELPPQNKVIRKKFRYIDPPFVDGDNLVRLSQADDQFNKELEEARQHNREGVRI